MEMDKLGRFLMEKCLNNPNLTKNDLAYSTCHGRVIDTYIKSTESRIWRLVLSNVCCVHEGFSLKLFC